jgi:molecular chaperone DnaK
MNVIIPRNTTIPVKAGEVFTTAVDAQREMLIHVLQGERERARDNWTLGKFTLEFVTAPKGTPRVGVQFEMDANGILHVLARDIRTGREKNVEIKSAVDVNDADVQKMIEESVEHAFDDLATRRWIEAKLQAEQTLIATRQALHDFAPSLDPAYRQEIESAVARVEEALTTEKPEANAGDLTRLKTSVGHLDAVTQKLADLMVDQAIEAKLRQQGLLQ